MSAGDGTASFDGEHVRLEWNWKTDDVKASSGVRTLAVADITTVEWQPSAGLENGCLRFTVRGAASKVPPKYDPNSVELWGFKKDPLMALVAAAVQARLPHPVTVVDEERPARELTVPAQARQPAVEDAHDALPRRLRELGDLHRTGVLTNEEFAMAEQAVLKRM